MSEKLEMATLAGGCFWCVEAFYQDLKGVASVVSGYTGGLTQNPTYQQVCAGNSGHAEAVQLKFDPTLISFEDLLHVFWRIHDPTTLNRQGADVGTQYRSAIFYHNDAQKAAAAQSLQETNAAGLWPNPIVTEITAASDFYDAEAQHQNFYKSNPHQPYCLMVIDPKMKQFRQDFQEKLQ